MSETEMDDAASATGWTSANMLKLIAAIRSTIPDSTKTSNYRTGLPVVDWDQVAFPPFSPEECREKWKSMMEKMRKLRSLPELIVEAEEAISDPLRHTKRRTFLGEPKMPSQTGYVYFAKDQMKILKENFSSHKEHIAKVNELWYRLPTKEKERFKEHIHANMKQYSENLQKWFKTLTSEEQTEYLKHNPRKLQFLDARERTVVVEEPLLCQPSDSEDEDMVINNDEGLTWSSYEDENEEVEEGGNMFEMYS